MFALYHAHADVGLLFVILAILAAGLGVWFLWARNYVGAVVAIFIAILIALFLT